ncbi:LOW QUALITY PROTEIN: FERM domain-containing protein 4A [Neophocaena asiaeorientalis asiaeorientalis]|uniref:LOW QUALITY PROTEIN: FERM domain-containing protein 4A n=1 Tax=Neophocaena asiaeorientalis asiaeorientalis TaxID=1706337 RepID=A0A341AT99_NEOAA|nr:LOW QUALITY PROTEIN: FERM domain-containing protein 4A [Neophocaena asiaeorientalis asiaeorientalis]
MAAGPQGSEDLLSGWDRLVWGLTCRVLRTCRGGNLRVLQLMLKPWCISRAVYQPKLLAKELLDLVASHFNLKEKEYFGIAFTDETGHLNWLQLDRRVLEHDFPKKSGPVVLYFCVRFYIESISYLKDNATIELFFLNAKSCIYKELIDVDSEVVFELASYILQEAKGDFSSNEVVRTDLKKLPALPTQALKEHPSLAYCEDRVIEHYKKLNGQTRGQAIVNYMSIVESLPTYGVHYYAVKDKQGIPWWLGLSYKGIFQYDYHDKVKPRKIFQWRQLENLYFREKKFSVEVHDPRRASVTRRTFGHSGIAVHTWYACPALIKSIWAMAISQHQFYLDRKQSKSKIHAARSLSEIAIDLTETGTLKTSKLASMGSKGKIISGSSGSLLSSGSQESDSSQSAKKDMLAALKSRQEALEETLRQRLEELKRLCLREAELTGKLPVEYPLDPGEEPPIVRRRIGTAFKLDEQKILPKGEEAELERLEREFAIQSQITEAARRLASDPNVSKKLKKQRKTSYLNALKKLQEIESAINENRVKSGKKPTQRASLIIEDGNIASEDSSLSDALVLEDEDSQVTSTLSPLQSPHKGLPPRPPSHNRPPPPQSLEGLRQMHCHRNDYDKSPIKPKMWSESSLDEPYEKVKKRSSHSHSSSHKRFPSTGSCAEAGGGGSSLQTSPIRSLPPWNSQCSMPSTPDLRVRSPHYVHSTRSVDLSPTRLHSLALHFRHRSSSLESQGKLLGSENDTGSPDFYTPRTRSSNGSDPMDDCRRDGGAHDKGAGRAAVSDELRQWYQRSSASHKEHSRLSHASSASSDGGSQYSASSQSTFVAHSRVTRMPQMCKATSAALPQSQRSSTPSSEVGATPPGSPHHILTWQTGSYNDSCFLDPSLYPELADVQWYGQEKAKPGTLV